MVETVRCDSGGGERLRAGPTTSWVKVAGHQTGGRLSAVEMALDPGWSGPPAHVHSGVDHLWWIVAGEVDLFFDGQTGRYGSGSCLFVPAGVAHGFSTAATAGATILQVDSPRALDDYFRDLAGELPPDRPPDPRAVAEIMARYDTRPVDR